jgi:hypothetical protein
MRMGGGASGVVRQELADVGEISRRLYHSSLFFLLSAPVPRLSMLNARDHSRDSAGLRYVYPVVSRRAGGVSLGINLNPNNACNWACVYCQVPNLTRGGPPPLDLPQLRAELAGFLEPAALATFMAGQVPENARRLVDVAFSGNGEPTSAPEFAEAVALVVEVLVGFGLRVPVRLITNGSLLHRPEVQRGIALLGEHGGEVWFKVDRMTDAGSREINGVPLQAEAVRQRLQRCGELAPTWVQTCYFRRDGELPGAAEEQAYLELLAQLGDVLRGVQLYGIARASCQPGAERLVPATVVEIEAFATRIRALGLAVNVAP